MYRSPSIKFFAITGKYTALAFYVAFAMFPLYWLMKISLTLDKLIFTEGTAMWPSELTFENFKSVILFTDFMAYFKNSVFVSLGTALVTTLIAAEALY